MGDLAGRDEPAVETRPLTPHGAGVRGPASGCAPDEERLARLLHRWWSDERPDWTDLSWWDATLREDVRRLLWLPAGPQLSVALAELPLQAECPVPHTQDRFLACPTPGHAPGWPCACQVVVAAAWEACAAWVAAGAARALVTAAGPEPVDFDVAGGSYQLHDPAREELAHALRWTVPSAGNRIAAARALVAHPGLVALVESATLSGWAARLVAEHLDGLTPAQADTVIQAVATRIRARLASGRRAYNSAEVNRLARMARLRVCPETEQQARIRAFADRRVVVHRRPDGMATLIADLAETDAYRIHRRLSAIAAGLQADASSEGQPETRTRDQLRADVLADLLLGTGVSTSTPPGADSVAPRPGSTGAAVADKPPTPAESTDARVPPAPSTEPAPTRPPARPDIQVIVTVETLLGLTQDPAEVPGLGTIPADTARTLAADGRWTAWITNAAGVITATGSAGYVPSAAVARLVRAREPHCRFPGCRQPATRCDLDHTIPWPRGTTTPHNLGPLCRRHHQLKTHGGWALEPVESLSRNGCSDPPGWRWRTPAGLTVVDEPEPSLASASAWRPALACDTT
jgi:hypothetical protein